MQLFHCLQPNAGMSGARGLKRLKVAVLGVLVLCIAAGPAASETLIEALASAYLTNPALKSARAKLRATDELVPRALSGYRPTIVGRFGWGLVEESTGFSTDAPHAQRSSFFNGTRYPTEFSITLIQPIFQGFRTVNAVNEADALVLAGREDLRAKQQTILLDAVTAYVDVLRDRSIVRLNRKNAEVLAKQLRSALERYDLGEVTKTDVAQSKARLNGAHSALSKAQADLNASAARFEQVIGRRPERLSEPRPIEALLPTTLDEALRIGAAEHPAIADLQFQEEAAQFAVERIAADLLPKVTFEASYARQFNPTAFIDDREIATFMLRVAIPLYQAGLVSADVRQAKETAEERQYKVEDIQRQVAQFIQTSWSGLTAARARIIADQAQIKANATALSGVRQEEKIGARTVLDVLNAEQELLDAQVAEARSRRDRTVAAFRLLLGIGRLSIGYLRVPAPRYDPTEHYRKVRFKAFGLGATGLGLFGDLFD